MTILRLNLTFLAGLFAVSAIALGQPPKLLIDVADAELLSRAPELAGVRFDHDEALVKTVLLPAFASVNQTFDKFADLSAAERIVEFRLEDGGAAIRSQTEKFRYAVSMEQGSLDIHETRLSAKGGAAAKAGQGGFAAGGRFFTLMQTMLPEFENQMRFRAVGRLGNTAVFAFVQTGPEIKEPVQGLVWIDTERARPRRLRCEPAVSPEGAAIDQPRVDSIFTSVHFDTLNADLLLPVTAMFDASQGSLRIHALHHFSDYRLHNPDAPGTYATWSSQPDPIENLAAAAAALDASNAPAAIAPLREALRLDSSLAAAHFHLARALRATGDDAEAETEARLALSAMPTVSVAPNLMGLVLIKRGAAADAAAEFRETVRLAPGDATARGNLSAALEAAGDRSGALAEARRATELAPANEALKARLDRLAANNNETVIRVDVRQVLVPVVVFDKSGHNISNLKQSDFRVLEDGVEQTISSFRVETTGSAGVEPPANPVQPKAKETAAAPRHTYLIAIDTLHTAFSNLHAVRDSLQKFFSAEPPGDSQYAVIAIAQSTTIIQNLTRDPSAALSSLDDKAFFKMRAGSRSSSYAAEMRDYIHNLQEVRELLDSGDRSGPQRLKQLPLDADHMAAQDRYNITVVLSGLRNLVSQMSAGTGHRTLLLISDGFQLSPGREAWELLRTYFPELPRTSIRTMDRMQTDFESVAKIASRSNVVINAIDSRGLYAPSWTDASVGGSGGSAAPRVISAMNSVQSEGAAALAEFAAATGGTMYQNSNDLLTGIRKAVAEGRDYYTLGYVSTNATMDGKFRNITVEVKGRNVRLRAKRGYWATSN